MKISCHVQLRKFVIKLICIVFIDDSIVLHRPCILLYSLNVWCTGTQESHENWRVLCVVYSDVATRSALSQFPIDSTTWSRKLRHIQRYPLLTNTITLSLSLPCYRIKTFGIIYRLLTDASRSY